MKRFITSFMVVAMCGISLIGCHNNETQATEKDKISSQQTFVSMVDEQKIRSEALELLMDWKMNNYDDFSVLESFGVLTTTAMETLGKDNRLYHILDSTYTFGMCLDNNNKTVVDMAINILAYDDGDLPVNFIDDTDAYVFNDNRYDYLNVFPVYDLSSGHYGIYNIETKEYIYEPVFTYLAEPDDSGYICARYNGYYGCLNMFGEKVVGFMYDKPITFSGTVAVVSTNNKYGVVNNTEEIILICQYDSVEICLKDDFNLKDSVIIANWSGGAQGKLYKSQYAYGAYNLSGKQIIPHAYLDYTFANGNIYMLENTYSNSQWYDLYDSTGNLMFGSGTSIPEICSVTLPGNYGISIGRSKTSKVNTNGVSTPGYRLDYWYTYITDTMEYLNDGLYQMEFAGYEVTPFNKKGYAVASIQGTAEGSTQTRVIINKEGIVLDEFAYIYTSSDYKSLKNNRADIDNIIGANYEDTKWYWLPIDANDYLYHMTYSSFSTHHALYVRSTEEIFECDGISMIDGTNLTIIKDSDTGLYGLYDGETLALDTIYNSIDYVSGQVIAMRGAEKTIYAPKN